MRYRVLSCISGVMLLLSLACNLGGGAKETATPETPATIAPTQVPAPAAATAAPTPGVELGAIKRNA